eukprot:jgi/Chlat1/7905/Chrsp67S07348
MGVTAGGDAVKALNTDGGRNRFKYKSFAQRLAGVEVDVFRSLAPISLQPTGASTFFLENLLQWRELNSAKDFNELYVEVLPHAQSLPQLVHHSKSIVSSLLKRMTLEAFLSLEPVLSLVASLARDLQRDFLPHVGPFIKASSALLQTGGEHQTEVLELTFTSISYVFKHLMKHLCAELPQVLRHTARLRHHKRPWVRDFAAEAVAYLFRQAPTRSLEKGFAVLMREVQANSSEERVDGAGALVAESVKGIAHGFQSRMDCMMHMATKAMVQHAPETDVAEPAESDTSPTKAAAAQLTTQVLSNAVVRLCEHIRRETAQPLWDVFMRFANERLAALEAQPQRAACCANAARAVSLVNAMLEYRSGTRVADYSPFFQLSRKLLQPSLRASLLEGDARLGAQTLRLLQTLINNHHREAGASTGLSAIANAAPSWLPAFELPIDILEAFMRSLVADDEAVVRLFVNHILSALDRNIDTHPEQSLSMLLELRMRLDAGGSNPKLLPVHRYRGLSALITSTTAEASAAASLDRTAFPKLYALFFCLPYAVTVPMDVLPILHKCADRLASIEQAGAGVASEVAALYGAVHSAIAALLPRASPDMLPSVASMLELLKTHAKSVPMLSAVAQYFSTTARMLPQGAESPFTKEVLLDVLPCLAPNLSSPNKDMRLLTLQILCHFGKADSSETEVLHQWKQVEETPMHMEQWNQSTLVVRRMAAAVQHNRLPEFLLPAVAHSALGSFHIRFSHVWDAARAVMVALAESHDVVLWPLLLQQLTAYQDQVLNADFSVMQSVAPRSDDTEGPARSLPDLFQAAVQADTAGDSTNFTTVFEQLLKALQQLPTTAERHSRQVVPLFLEFVSDWNEVPGSGISKDQGTSRGGKTWRALAKQWLKVVAAMKNAKALYRSEELRRILFERFLMDMDPEVQQLTLASLNNHKDASLLRYSEQLERLINYKTAREEMARWNLSVNAGGVQPKDRSMLMPHIVRIMFPKLRKKSGKVAGRSAAGISRKAALIYLSHLEPHELAPLFSLIIAPLIAMQTFATQPDWLSSLSDLDAALSAIDLDALQNVTPKQVVGFLHVALDAVSTLRWHVLPYLNALIAFVLRLIQLAFEDNASNASNELGKEVRGLALRFMHSVVAKHPTHNIPSTAWDVFFLAVRPAVARLISDAAGDRPSNLLECFVAMSQHTELIPLLARDATLMPALVTLLSAKSLTPAVEASVISIVLNVLDTENEETGQHFINLVLSPHLCLLLQHVGQLLARRLDHSSKGKAMKAVKRALSVCVRLAPFIEDSATANQMLDTLLPFLQSKAHLRQGTCVEVLRVISSIGSMLPDSLKYAPRLSPLFATLSTRDARTALCDAYEALSQPDPSTLQVAKQLQDLNAWSTVEVDEPDYDRRMVAYARMNAAYYTGISVPGMRPLLGHALRDLHSPDLSLRTSASQALRLFIEYAMQAPDDVRSLVPKLLYPQITLAISSAEDFSVRQEAVGLLHDIVKAFPTFMAELQCLLSLDPEQAFFSNIVHLQTHRRIRALAKLRSLASSISPTLLNTLFVPMIGHVLTDAKSAKDGNLMDEAVRALAAIALQLPWGLYFSLLMRYLRYLPEKAASQKVLVRAICALLDAFHFNENAKEDVDMHDVATTDNVNETRHHEDEGPEVVVPDYITAALKSKLFPELKKYVLEEGEQGTGVRVPIALATVKVLKLLPEAAMQAELPGVLQTVTNLMKSRMQSIRDTARETLASMATELGAPYLHYLVDVLKSSLTQGYQVHVLGYTLHAVLSKSIPAMESGAIDYCLSDIVDMLMSDIMGSAAEEREVDAIAAKMKETKRCRSFESFELVTRVTTFKTHFGVLLRPIKEHLDSTQSTRKIRDRVDEMLRHIARGLQTHAGLKPAELLVFIHSTVNDGLQLEQLRRRPDGDSRNQQQSNQDKVLQDTLLPMLNTNVLVVFALQVLYTSMKKGLTGESATETHSLLDPMVPLLSRALMSRETAVLSMSLKNLCLLLRMPLPSMDACASDITQHVFDILHRSGSNTAPLVQDCLKLLTTLLRHSQRSELVSDTQLKHILNFAFTDIEDPNTQSTTFALLKAIVTRRLVVPELYDLMNKVSALMVRSQAAPVRHLCSQVLLQFLLDYPLGPRRLQHHLEFIVTNLMYEHSTGREAALEMLHLLVSKFPQVLLDEQAEFFFLPLVSRLVNDENATCRAMLATVMRLLMNRVSPNHRQQFLDYAIKWYGGNDAQLRRAAIQVLGLVVQISNGKLLENRRAEVLPLMLAVLTRAAGEFDAGAAVVDADVAGAATFASWQEAYYTLTCLERLLQCLPNLLSSPEWQGIWRPTVELLLHRHAWVRRASTRLLGLLFAADVTIDQLLSGSLESIEMRHISRALCEQLSNEHVDAKFADQIVKNLLFVATVLATLPSSHGVSNGHARAEDVNHAGASSADEGSDEDIDEEVGDDREANGSARSSRSPLEWLFVRLSKLATKPGEVQRQSVLRWFAAVTSKLSPKVTQPFLPEMVLPLIRVREPPSGQVVSDDLKALAEEVTPHLQEVFGVTTFVERYNAVRQRLRSQKDSRKRALAIEALVDPEKHARKKLKKNVHKHASRKRKIAEHKRYKG